MTVGVRFFGVWGSTPLVTQDSIEFGGNTSCVVIENGSEGRPIICDLGTGVISYGAQLAPKDLDAAVLLTHLHFDHITGLPFFVPMLSAKSKLEIWGRPCADTSLAGAIDKLISPPFFPVTIDEFPPEVTLHDTLDTEFFIDGAKVTVRTVPHTCPTNGYRIEFGDKTVTYIPDHQQPEDGSFLIDEAVLELADGADLLIHDAQYTPELFKTRSNWGHSTAQYAVEVALRSNVSKLVLHSHDQIHNDVDLLTIEADAIEAAKGEDLVVIAGRDGLEITL